jgi:protein-S-isoprenylcysteine O-methyltransferase Ste14
MNRASNQPPAADDRASVAFHPPLLLLPLIVIGFVGDWLLAAPFLNPEWASPIGAAIVAVSWAFFAWAVITMLRGGASIPTNTGTDAIVKHGPFRISRNPIYVSMVLLLIGIGCWANSIWFLVFAAIDAVALNYGVITAEERYLESKFGETYLDYKKRVRRWI